VAELDLGKLAEAARHAHVPPIPQTTGTTDFTQPDTYNTVRVVAFGMELSVDLGTLLNRISTAISGMISQSVVSIREQITAAGVKRIVEPMSASHSITFIGNQCVLTVVTLVKVAEPPVLAELDSFEPQLIPIEQARRMMAEGLDLPQE